MKKFLKVPICILLLVLTLASLTAPAAAKTVHEYDLASEGILSAYYTVDSANGFLKGVAPGTSLEKLLKVCTPAGITASAETAATGTVLKAAVPGQKPRTLKVVVSGDLNGDAAVTITDMLKIKSAILGKKLSTAAAAAADLNADNTVSITDFLKIKSCLLGLTKLTDASKPTTPGILMMPNSKQKWAEVSQKAVSFSSAAEDIVRVGKNGGLFAGVQEGSAFVYAYNAKGKVIDRILVTVLNEPATITLGQTKLVLTVGQKHTLTPVFNHPLAPAVTWRSSDPAVVSVENGVLTPKTFGKAVVTASLPNGSKAKVAVTVAPPITSVSFDRTLYKIKPGSRRALGLVTVPADTSEELIWTSSNPAVAKVSADGTVTGVAYGTAKITVKGKYSGLSASCTVKICNVKQVAITFDDGPSGYTSTLLDFLKENDLKATFFMVGNRLPSFPDTVRRIAAEGHELGYHSYAHVQQTTMSSDKITQEFQASNRMLKNMTGREFTVWRTPGGGYNDRVLSCVPLPHILWSVDTRDWATLNQDSVYSMIMRYSGDGSIILLHDLYGSSVNGAIRAMREMMAGDYEFLTVTELLSRDGTPPKNSATYMYG